MSEKKPTPLLDENGQICPVCGKRSYSAAGVHPQCAMKRADDARREQRTALPREPARTRRRRSWDKKCPKCETLVHVRSKVCPCGYTWPDK